MSINVTVWVLSVPYVPYRLDVARGKQFQHHYTVRVNAYLATSVGLYCCTAWAAVLGRYSKKSDVFSCIVANTVPTHAHGLTVLIQQSLGAFDVLVLVLLY